LLPFFEDRFFAGLAGFSLGRSLEAKRIAEACDKLIRLTESTREQLTAGQCERLSALTMDELIAAVG
jgi:hypothetical protein